MVISNSKPYSIIKARHHGWNLDPMIGLLFCLCVGPVRNGQRKFHSLCY